MDANVSEVAPDIFRISVFPPGSPVSYGCFLNRFLAVAPNAEPVASPIGARVTLRDFSDRPPRMVGNGEKLSLGRKELRIVLAPWVHYWDSLLVYDETDRLLFTSDLFMQPGDREPIASEDRSSEVVDFCRFSGLLPSQKHLERALDRIEPLRVETLACHHGSVLTGDPRRYYRALRQNVVGDVVDAPFYEMRTPPSAPR